MSIQAQFKIKSDTKIVEVNFFSEDYNFINHLKRSALEQIRGSVQKNTVLSLINSGNFIVTKGSETLYNHEASINIENVGLVVSNVAVELNPNKFETDELLNTNSIEEVCEQLDILEERSRKLHLRLQHLLGLEEEILHEKLALI